MIEHEGREYEVSGERIGQVIQICYKPLMKCKIVGWNPEWKHWLGQYIVPEKLDTYAVFTEEFMSFMQANGDIEVVK